MLLFQIHTANRSLLLKQVFVVPIFSQGKPVLITEKTCSNHRENLLLLQWKPAFITVILFTLQITCFQNRDFPARSPVLRTLYGIAVDIKSKHLLRWLKWPMIWLWCLYLNLTFSAARGELWCFDEFSLQSNKLITYYYLAFPSFCSDQRKSILNWKNSIIENSL